MRTEFNYSEEDPELSKDNLFITFVLPDKRGEKIIGQIEFTGRDKIRLYFSERFGLQKLSSQFKKEDLKRIGISFSSFMEGGYKEYNIYEGVEEDIIEDLKTIFK